MISIPAWVLGTIQLTISQLLDFWNSWSFHLRVSCLHIQPSIYSKINRNPFSDLWSSCIISSFPESYSATSSCFKVPDLWSPSQLMRPLWNILGMSPSAIYLGMCPWAKSQCGHQAQLICFLSGIMIQWVLLFNVWK